MAALVVAAAAAYAWFASAPPAGVEISPPYVMAEGNGPFDALRAAGDPSEALYLPSFTDRTPGVHRMPYPGLP